MWTRFSRLLSACIVIVPSVFAIVLGAQIVAFAGARWAAEHSPADSGARLEPWFSVRGLEFAARNAAIKTQSNLNLLQDQLAEMVTQSPLSAATWNAIAGLDLASGAPVDAAVQALTMSAVTAPNELHLMPARAKLGIALWEKLPAERRNGIAIDLVTASRWGYFNEDKPVLSAILKGKSEAVREQIMTLILQVEGASAAVVTDLGFPAPPAR